MDPGLTTVAFEENDSKFFNKFIGDLSCNIKVSVKTLFDNYMDEQRCKRAAVHDKMKAKKVNINGNGLVDIDFSKSKGGKGKKNSGIKKKDLIIMNQKKTKTQSLIKEDLLKIDNFTFSVDDIYKNMAFLKTTEGIVHYKFTIFQYLISHYKKINPPIIGLYYQLQDCHTLNVEFNKSLDKITDKLQLGGYDMTQYMLTNLGHMLPPLNFWDHNKKKLDDWQIQILRNAKNSKSSIVLAPTSSGKTFTAIGVSLFKNRVLYIVPTKPVAYQVASQFYKMNIKYVLLTDDNIDSSIGTSSAFCNVKIFIATPEYAEKYLPVIGVKFDYAVFDEIHNLRKEDDGHMYENIIKMIRCDFLALSASIGNIEYIRDKWMEFNPGKRIELVKYSKRFINLQRHIWNGTEIVELHPLACISAEDLDTTHAKYIDFVDKYDLAFTPNDTINLFLKIEKHFESIYVESDSDDDDDDSVQVPVPELNVYNWRPCKFFEKYKLNSKLITLNQAKEYENFLKEKLKVLYEHYPDKTAEMLASFNIGDSAEFNITRKLTKTSVYDIFRNLFTENMGPAIVFNVNTETCYQIFYDLYHEIIKRELEEFPYHYDILEYKQKLYLAYRERSEQFNSKLTEEERFDKMEKFRRREMDAYVKQVSEYYQKLLGKIDENAELDVSVRSIQHDNLEGELVAFLNYPDLGYKDVFKKHRKFCFTKQEPMSGDTIREIRREIKKSTGIQIDYESVLFQMLKRGIGIYNEQVPDIYKWIVQKLVSEKKLYFVISDRTLCLGIDLPFRSSVLMGYGDSYEFTENDFTQMSGRAGRRGLDDKGNIVFCGNIKPLKLMKGKHQCIVSNPHPHSDLMHILEVIGSKRKTPLVDSKTFTKEHIDSLYKNNLNPEKNVPEDQVEMYNSNAMSCRKYSMNMLNIIWNLRYENYNLIEHFIHQMNLLEKKLYMKGSQNVERYLYHYLCEFFVKKNKYHIVMGNVNDIDEFININEGNVLMSIMTNVIIENRILIDPEITEYSSSDISAHLKYLGRVIIYVYNELYKDTKYMIICRTLKKLLEVIKHIIFNNIKSIQNQC